MRFAKNCDDGWLHAVCDERLCTIVCFPHYPAEHSSREEPLCTSDAVLIQPESTYTFIYPRWHTMCVTAEEDFIFTFCICILTGARGRLHLVVERCCCFKSVGWSTGNTWMLQMETKFSFWGSIINLVQGHEGLESHPACTERRQGKAWTDCQSTTELYYRGTHTVWTDNHSHTYLDLLTSCCPPICCLLHFGFVCWLPVAVAGCTKHMSVCLLYISQRWKHTHIWPDATKSASTTDIGLKRCYLVQSYLWHELAYNELTVITNDH